MTLGATLTTTQVAHGISSGANPELMHGPTFMGNPLACAAATASLQLLLDGPWAERVGRIAAQLRTELSRLADCPAVADVRTLGAIGVVEMKAPVDAAKAQEYFVDRGVWVRPFGRLVYLMPPFIIDSADLAQLTDAVAGFVSRDSLLLA